MNCKICGTPLDENATFCGNCGASAEPEAPAEAPAQSPAEAPAENFFAEQQPEAPKKKSKAPIIIAIVALIAVVIGVLGFVFWDDLFGDTAVETVDDEAQLAYALTHYSEGEDMFTDKLLAEMNDTAAQGSVTLKVSEMLTSSLGISASEITVKYDVDYIIDEKMSMFLDAYVGQTEIVGADLYFDFAANKMVIDLPGLIEKPLEVNVDNGGEEFAQAFASMTTANTESVKQSAEAIEAFLKIAYESLLDIEFTSSEQVLTANGVSEEMLCFDVPLNAETIKSFAVKFLENVKNSAEIKKLFTATAQSAGTDAETIYNDFIDSTNEAIASVKDSNESMPSGTIKLWVDDELVIQGLKATLTANNETVDLFFGCAEADGKVGLEVTANVVGAEQLKVLGSGTVANDVYNMDIELFAEGQSVATVKVSDFMSNSEGVAKGKFEIKLDSSVTEQANEEIGGLLANASVIIDFNCTETTYDFAVSLNMGGAMELFKLSSNGEVSGDASVNVPTDVTTDLNAFSAIDPSVLITRLEEAGVPVSDLMQMIGSMSGQSDSEMMF